MNIYELSMDYDILSIIIYELWILENPWLQKAQLLSQTIPTLI